MSTEANKANVERFLDEAFNHGRFEAVHELFLPEVDVRSPTEPEPIRNAAEFERFVRGVRAGFPDLRVDLHDFTAEGDLVAVRGQVRGTHLALYRGIPPTRRTIDLYELILVRFRGDSIAGGWHAFDQLEFMRQLGLFPRGEPPRAIVGVVVAAQRLRARGRRAART